MRTLDCDGVIEFMSELTTNDLKHFVLPVALA
jgi:hypothetical protein